MFNHVRLSSLAVISGLALAASIAVPQLRADDTNKKTTMTFSAPVEISGESLPAGTYVFKTLYNDRDIVLVMDRDDSHLVTIVHAIPVENSSNSDKARVELSEGIGNSPEVVHAWFYPGQTTGWEFPAAKAVK
jgi:Protein of unknown function (DUF2911)